MKTVSAREAVPRCGKLTLSHYYYATFDAYQNSANARRRFTASAARTANVARPEAGRGRCFFHVGSVSQVTVTLGKRVLAHPQRKETP
jgi:hypothetical protein